MASINFKLTRSVEIDDVEREMVIEVSFSKGRPASRFAYNGEGDPGDPDEIIYEGAWWKETMTPLTDEEFELHVNSNSRVDDAVYDYLSEEGEE